MQNSPNNYDTNSYEEEDGSLSLRKLWNLVKLSATRMLIFCIIAAVVMVTVSFVIINTTRKQNQHISTVINYNYDGIDEGNDPYGRTLNVNRIKSATVVSKALDVINSAGDNIDPALQQSIINGITIEGVIPDDVMQQILIIKEIATNNSSALSQLSDIEYHPSSYVISLKNLNALNLSQTTAKALLNEIVNQYIIQFKKDYLEQPLLSGNIVTVTAETADTVLAAYDYLEISNIYYSYIVQATSYVNGKSNTAPKFRSIKTGKTFSDIASELSLLRTIDLNKYDSAILSNGLTTDIESLVNSLQLKITQTKAAYDESKAKADAYFDAIEKYDNGQTVVVGPNGETVLSGVPTQAYNNLFNNYTAYVNQAAQYDSVLKNYQTQLDVYYDTTTKDYITNPNNTAENQAAAKVLAQKLSAAVTNLISVVNDTVEEYLDTEYFDNAVKMVVPATYNSTLETNFGMMLIVSILVVIVAAIIAMIVTHVKVKKIENNKDKATANANEDTESNPTE